MNTFLNAFSAENFLPSIIAIIPPTLIALGAFISSLKVQKTSARVEEKVNGSLALVTTKLSENIQLVADTRQALQTSIILHETQIAALKDELTMANQHISRLILTPEQLKEVVYQADSNVDSRAAWKSADATVKTAQSAVESAGKTAALVKASRRGPGPRPGSKGHQ